jgi:hypothetical protein
MLARLRAACEQAKIELSRAERASIVVPDAEATANLTPRAGDHAGDLEALTEPFIARSLAAVRVLLAKNQRGADDVARVVLVGGPTLMPGLRARVGELFGGRIAAGVDPMTIVARGAALYAGSVGLDATPARARRRARRRAARPHRAPVGDRRSGTVRRRALPARRGSDAARAACASNARETTAAGRAPTPRCLPRAASCCRCAGTQPPQPVRRARVRSRRRRGRAGDGRVRDRARCLDRRSAAGARHRHRARGRHDPRLLPKGTPLPARRTFAHHTGPADRRAQRR